MSQLHPFIIKDIEFIIYNRHEKKIAQADKN